VRAGQLYELDERLNGLTARQEIVDDEHVVARPQVLRRNHQVGKDALGVRGGAGVHGIWVHSDRAGLAGIDDRDAQGQSGRQGRRDTTDFGGNNLVGAQVGKTGSQGATHGKHQGRIDLVVDKAVNLQDAVAQVFAFAYDPLF
jgi:hypothetical protein